MCLERQTSAPLTSAIESGSLLPTPVASNYGSSNNGHRPDGSTYKQAGKLSLRGMAAKNAWPTPNARDGKGAPGAGTIARGGRQASLPAAVNRWPTPKARDWKKSAGGNRHSPDLSTAVKWATPTVKGNYNRKGASPQSGDGLATQAGGPLNPTWVEWLMGWPLGWTDLRASATDRFQQWQHARGGC
jgi:hypothetical protein